MCREAGVPELPGCIPLMTWASDVAAETPLGSVLLTFYPVPSAPCQPQPSGCHDPGEKNDGGRDGGEGSVAKRPLVQA